MEKQQLWDKIKKTVVDGMTTAAEKTEEYTKLGKAKIEVLAVKRKISKNFAELGGIVYDAVKAKKEKEVFDSPESKILIATLNDLDKELEAKEKALEDLSKEESAKKSK